MISRYPDTCLYVFFLNPITQLLVFLLKLEGLFFFPPTILYNFVSIFKTTYAINLEIYGYVYTYKISSITLCGLDLLSKLTHRYIDP